MASVKRTLVQLLIPLVTLVFLFAVGEEVMYALNYGLRFDPDGVIIVRSRFVAFFGSRIKELLQRIGVNMKTSEKAKYSDLNSEGFTLRFDALEFIDREMRARGIESHAVLYPPLQRLDDDYYNRLILKKIEDFCVANRIRCFSLFDSFRGRNPAELRVTNVDYHPNRYANRIASEAIADYLRRTSELF